MRFALIDNSTLTGVQRLLGQIPIKNTLSIDMDILCLESLLEAILFYDIIAVIDDYKPAYRNNRKDAFPQLLSLDPDHISYTELLSNAKSITDGIIPRVVGGQFTDGDFKPFFDLLKMNVTFTWDMSSSIYFLTQKMLAGIGGLDLEKYSKLNTAIFFELADKRRSEHVGAANDKLFLVGSDGHAIDINTKSHKLVDKDGKEREIGGLSDQASMYFAGLNWLAFRAILYTIAANSLGADLFLHPIRQSFQVNFLSKLHQEDTTIFKPLIDAMTDAANTSINRILSNTQPIVTKQPIPMFVAWFAQKVQDPHKYIEVAYNLRNEAPFNEARQKFIELESLAISDREKFVIESNKLLKEVGQSLEVVCSKYGASTSQGASSSSLIKLWNLSSIITKLPNIPEFDFHIPQLESIKSILPLKGFRGVYRNVISDLTQVSRLGEYYNIAASRVTLDKEAGAFFEKTEDIRYRKYRSGWKIPM